MAVVKQFGRPISLVTVSPAKTISDIRSWSYKPNIEIIKDGPSGNKQTSSYLQGELMDEITIETTDRSAYASFPQGTIVTTATLTVEDTRIGSGALKSTGAVLTVVLSGCTVVNAIELKGDSSGKPTTYSLTFRQSDDASGTSGTSTVTVAA